MNNDLLINLINISVIKPGTDIAILRYGYDMAGAKIASLLLNVYDDEDKDGNQNKETIRANHIVETSECGVDDEGLGYIRAFSIIDGKSFKLYAHDVKLIDHMLPEKIGKVYGFNPDGSKRKQGKKRGRKPNKFKLRE